MTSDPSGRCRWAADSTGTVVLELGEAGGLDAVDVPDAVELFGGEVLVEGEDHEGDTAFFVAADVHVADVDA